MAQWVRALAMQAQGPECKAPDLIKQTTRNRQAQPHIAVISALRLEMGEQ